MDFRVLHISDVHFAEESTSRWVERERILHRIREKKLTADCLVISGDLFHRGSLTGQEAIRCKDYIQTLQRDLGNPTLLIVPGNHDLDRLARVEIENQYNLFLNRRDIVYRASEKGIRPDGEYPIANKNAEKTVLYKNSFDAFRRFLRELGSGSFCNPNVELIPQNYEIQEITLPFPDSQNYGIRFVMLNTALFAGQSIQGNDFRQRYQKLAEAHRTALNDGDPIKAAKIALEMAQKQKNIEDHGEIIVDEESPGRLSLSKEGNDYLSREVPVRDTKNCHAVFTIFVGHHGCTYLSNQTVSALHTAMKKCKSGIYLCGHAHLARYSRSFIQGVSEPKDLHQIQAGVMFKDSDDYAQYGFNFVTATLENQEIQINVCSHYLLKSPSQEALWGEEELLNYSLPLPELRASDHFPDNTSLTEDINNTTDEQYEQEDLQKQSPVPDPGDQGDDRQNPRKGLTVQEMKALLRKI